MIVQFSHVQLLAVLREQKRLLHILAGSLCGQLLQAESQGPPAGPAGLMPLLPGTFGPDPAALLFNNCPQQSHVSRPCDA